MAGLFSNARLANFTKVIVRYKRGPNHWLEIKRKKKVQQRALEHFDDFYGNVFGAKWQDIRAALLEESHKYIAVVNNFSDSEKTQQFLKAQGAVSLKEMYDVGEKNLLDASKHAEEIKMGQKNTVANEEMNHAIADGQMSKIESLYPEEYQGALATAMSEENERKSKATEEEIESAQMKTIEPNLNEVTPDDGRIITSGVNVSGLYEYVPATKIKGVNEWVLESEYYGHYTKGKEHSIEIVEETRISFPKYLHAYCFGENDDTRFSPPNLGSTNVLDYYLFDGASILPVLALDLKPGEVILDMCAAPGGKSLAILQTLMPKVLVLNDILESRLNKLIKVFDQFTKGFNDIHTKVVLTQEDATLINNTGVYDKILVDVPCTTDRHSLHNDENNIFKPSRVKERLQIPAMQTEILLNAFKVVKKGGTVVYSTCSLSPIQNDGVVQLAIKRAWEEENIRLVVKKLTTALKPLEYFFDFGDFELKYGHIAIPTLKNNWGPMYFSKITRVD